VPLPVAIAAGVTAIGSILAYFFAPRDKLSRLTLVIYLALIATIGMLVIITGGTRSPFIALWMLASIFVGMFGMRSIIGLLIATITYYIVSAFTIQESLLSGSEIIIFIFAFILPLVASWLMWHQKAHTDGKKDRAYTELIRELSQVANKSEIVINAIVDGVIAVDSSGTIQLINPAAQEIIGWGKQDAMKLSYKSVLKLVDKSDQPLDPGHDPIQQVLQTNRSVTNNDLTLLTNSGRKLLVSVLVSPVGQQGAGAIIVFRDITADKKEEREMAEFISTASHEMRTPVAAIEGYLALAINPATATIDDKARIYLSKAQESVRHLGQLFQDLLDISRVDDGRMKNNPKIVDVVAYTGEIVNTFVLRAKEKGLVLLYKPNLPNESMRRLTPVYYSNVDNDHLREVISNLIENAVKYTQKGNVTIDITADNNHVTVSVHDTGIGIPPEDAPHLFQKFYRVDNTQTRDIGGTGLGLYLCRRLVETMGGRLWLESVLGQGSTFFVELPRVQHEDAMRIIEQTSTEESGPQIQMTK
jgi:PAS domain S-box-containing protein